MRIIACSINIFDYDHTVYLVHEDGKTLEELGKSTLQHLDHFITTLCDQNDVTTVRLMGLPQYTAPLKKRIEDESIARYKKRIEVHINNE